MLLSTLALQLFSVGLAAVDPGPLSATALSSAACATCHVEVHDEWQRSRHGTAWTNAIFQREYRLKPNDWCVHCHAPLKQQLEQVHAGGGSLANEGVSCAVCHVRDGQIMATRHHDGSPHKTRIEPALSEPSFCAGCHQFNFPRPDEDDRVTSYTPHPMQNTVAEHAAGPHAKEACRTCHAQSPFRHAYPGGHDPTMLQRAVALDVCRERGVLVMTLRNHGAGHRIPTGDVHRHLVLRAWRPSTPQSLSETVLSRRFEPLPEGGKHLISDTSLAPGEARVTRVPLASLGPADAERTLAIELRFVYTTDEFPLQPVGEPTWTSIDSRRLADHALPRCK